MRMPLPLPHLDALPLGAHRLLALTDEALCAQTGVRIAFTGRAGGVSAGIFATLNTASHVPDDPECVAENRRRVLEALGAQGAALIVPQQVHGTHLVSVSEPADAARAAQEASAGADAVIVECADVAALLNFADCLSLILVAPDGRFAIVHAGWRGAIAGIAGLALRALAGGAEDATDAAQCNAYIGPHIHAECFEVGADIAKLFEEAFGPCAVAANGNVSLAEAVRCDLVRAGADPARILDAGVCTKCHPDEYFSYRASGGKYGCHAAAAFRSQQQ